jgi:threonine/homoserine/homoserine lactone efflux protein
MDASTLAVFAGFAAVLIALPGPDWAFVLGAGARDRIVIPAVAGLVGGYALLTAIVAAGVGSVMAATPTARLALTVIGALYLVYLGITGLRTGSGDRPGDPTVPARAAAGRTVRRGVAVSALNPKGVLFFVAFLPQFAHPANRWPIPVQLAVLGGVWAVIVAAFYTTLGYTAARVLTARPGVARTVQRVAGVAMIVLGILLLVDRLG